MMPSANAYVPAEQARAMEPFYPLHAYVCSDCRLVQLEDIQTPQALFDDYAYFSSYSESWLRHAEQFAERMTHALGLDHHSQVIEVASNDGYLLQFFQQRGVRVQGVDPAANVAAVAVAKGVPTDVEYFGVETASRMRSRGLSADLLVANNVLAHVPDVNDFVAGMKMLLNPGGTLTVEFPHLLRLIAANQFDTIYHEHYSYFSLQTVERIFAAGGLTVTDVEELSTHGGSLRIFARHEEAQETVSENVGNLKHTEHLHGLDRISTYREFGEQIKETKRNLLEFLIAAKRDGARIAGYGAPAKAATLLNYCGVGADFIDFTVDRNPHKQNHYLPGTQIPIRHPDAIRAMRPDYVLILPWNLRDEIVRQLAYVSDWGGRFVVPIPEVEVLS